MATTTASFDLISPTAILVALMRAQSNIPCSAEIAEICSAKKKMEALVGDHLPTILSLRSFIELRFKSLSAAVLRRRYSNIVELAGGLSPRGLLLTADPFITFIDVDLPAMMLEKQKVIGEMTGYRSRPNYKMLSGNVLRPRIFDVFESFLQPGPVAIIHEGLFNYFSRDEQKKLALNIRKLLGKFGGAWITPDISFRASMEKLLAMDERLPGIVKYLSGVTSRDLLANSFADREEAMQFFDDAGFEWSCEKQEALVPSIAEAIADPKLQVALRSREIWTMRLKS